MQEAQDQRCQAQSKATSTGRRPCCSLKSLRGEFCISQPPVGGGGWGEVLQSALAPFGHRKY